MLLMKYNECLRLEFRLYHPSFFLAVGRCYGKILLTIALQISMHFITSAKILSDHNKTKINENINVHSNNTNGTRLR